MFLVQLELFFLYMRMNKFSSSSSSVNPSTRLLYDPLVTNGIEFVVAPCMRVSRPKAPDLIDRHAHAKISIHFMYHQFILWHHNDVTGLACQLSLPVYIGFLCI